MEERKWKETCDEKERRKETKRREREIKLDR